MDGNGRWAKTRHLPRAAGHRQGKKTLEIIGDEIQRLGIPYLTVYAFSMENWSRPKEEVSTLMSLLSSSLREQLDRFIERKIRIRFIGDFSQVPEAVWQEINKVERETASFSEFNFTIALSYGGRQEIVSACQKIAEAVARGALVPEAITADLIHQNVYCPELPDPDLIIRTGGEKRTSNFLVWQSAYSELAFSEKKWPDFGVEDLHAILKTYVNIERRYGKISEQL